VSDYKTLRRIMKRLAVSLLLIASALVLAACGGGAAPQTPAAASTEAAAPASVPSSVPASFPTPASVQPTEPAVPMATPIVALDDPSLQATASGLKYSDIVMGTGATPAADDWVTIEFTATLRDGTLIGSSRMRGGPMTFGLTDMAKEVAGLAEGLSTMKVGGQRELVIPADLAYGDKGAGNVIPPNATLVFLVDMIGTKPAPKVDFTDKVVGTGDEAKSGMIVKINYTGTLTNGTVFGSSAEPVEFMLGAQQGGPGWDEGVPGMKVGGTRMLTVPPELAYGPQGNGSTIPPDATLTFEIELLDVRPAPQVEIQDLQVGTGAEAVPGKSVVVNYTGTLTNGVVFDSSFQRNEPFTLTLGAGQVIPGWEQGLQGMKVGGTRVITIPSELAYGAQGAGSTIPPNATLIFQIQMVDVK
jgi:peptidylprolyl isomerase